MTDRTFPRRRHLAGTIIVLILYWAGLAAILETGTGLSGFEGEIQGFRRVVELSGQMVPTLAAAVMLLTAPIWAALASRVADRVIPRSRAEHINEADRTDKAAVLAGTLAVALLPAGLLLLVSAGVAAVVTDGRTDGIAGVTIAIIGAGLFIDLYLVSLFMLGLYAMTKRRWLAGLVFLLYVGVVLSVGSLFGAVPLIGFASTPIVTVSAFSDAPLGAATAWGHRAYWVTVSGAAVFWVAWRCQRPRTARRLAVGLAGLTALGAAAMMGILADRLARAGAPLQMAEIPLENARDALVPDLETYDLFLSFDPEDGVTNIRGDLVFSVPGAGGADMDRPEMDRPEKDEPADRAGIGLALPRLPILDRLSINGREHPITAKTGDWILIPAEVADSAGMLRLDYSGTIPAEKGGTAYSMKPHVLDGGFFLNHFDLIFRGAPTACPRGTVRQPPPVCSAPVNYQLADTARGHITVDIPDGFTAVAPGRAMQDGADSGRIRTRFVRDDEGLTAFMIAAGVYRVFTAGDIELFTTDHMAYRETDRRQMAAVAEAAEDALTYLRGAWGPVPGHTGPVRIVMVPDRITTAVSYPGLVALGESLLTRRAHRDMPDMLLRTVVAHELAHQWWGYRLIPARQDGWLFLLEAFTQFTAYRYAIDNGYMTPQRAMAVAGKGYRSRSGKAAPPLARVSEGHGLVYSRGTQVLLALDRESGGSLLPAMGEMIRMFGRPASSQTPSPVPPQKAMDALLAALPPDIAPRARHWLMETNPHDLGELLTPSDPVEQHPTKP